MTQGQKTLCFGQWFEVDVFKTIVLRPLTAFFFSSVGLSLEGHILTDGLRPLGTTEAALATLSWLLIQCRNCTSLSLCLGFADGLHHTFKRTDKRTSTVKKWTGMKKRDRRNFGPTISGRTISGRPISGPSNWELDNWTYDNWTLDNWTLDNWTLDNWTLRQLNFCTSEF